MAERISNENLELNDLLFVTYDSAFADGKTNSNAFSKAGSTLMYMGSERKYYKNYGFVTVLQMSYMNSMRIFRFMLLPRGLLADMDFEKKYNTKRYHEMIRIKDLDDEDMFHWELAGKNVTIGNRR